MQRYVPGRKGGVAVLVEPGDGAGAAKSTLRSMQDVIAERREDVLVMLDTTRGEASRHLLE